VPKSTRMLLEMGGRAVHIGVVQSPEGQGAAGAGGAAGDIQAAVHPRAAVV